MTVQPSTRSSLIRGLRPFAAVISILAASCGGGSGPSDKGTTAGAGPTAGQPGANTAGSAATSGDGVSPFAGTGAGQSDGGAPDAGGAGGSTAGSAGSG